MKLSRALPFDRMKSAVKFGWDTSVVRVAYWFSVRPLKFFMAFTVLSL